MLRTRAVNCKYSVILNVIMKVLKVFVARKSLSMFGINAPIIANAVKVNPSSVENTVDKNGTTSLVRIIS